MGEASEEERDEELSDPRGEDEDEVCCVDGLTKKVSDWRGYKADWPLRKKSDRIVKEYVNDRPLQH